jgi:hypothetical protein
MGNLSTTARQFTLTLLTLLVGCAPESLYRRTALVPTPVAESLVRAPRGAVQATGAIDTGAEGVNRYPELGEASVLRADTSVHGEVRFTAGRHVVIGAQAMYAHVRMAHESATATPPLGRRASTGGIGPNLSVHVPVHPRVTLGFGAALTLGIVPWTVYERLMPSTGVESEFVPSEHRIANQGRDVLVFVRIAAGVSHRLHDWVDLDYGLSLQNAAFNVGFSDTPASGSTLRVSSFGVLPFVGVTLRLPNGFLARFAYAVPFGFAAYDSDDGSIGNFQFAVGVDLDRRAAPAP